jgi:alpha-L-rhamnosidase
MDLLAGSIACSAGICFYDLPSVLTIYSVNIAVKLSAGIFSSHNGRKDLTQESQRLLWYKIDFVYFALSSRSFRLKYTFILQVLLFFASVATAQSPDNPKFQTTFIKPVKTVEMAPDHYFFDFGKDAFGKLLLRIKTIIPDTLIIHLGERSPDGTSVDRNPGGTIRYRKAKLPISGISVNYTLILPPDKRNTNPPAIPLPDSFGVIMPFRYCEIENLKDVSSVEIVQKVYSYCFNENSSSFSCSDTILNKIWDLCKYSIKATSFCGFYIDGDRERIPYEADAYINQLSHYAVDNEYSLARRTNKYFIKNPTWPTEWILTTVLMFYNDYMYTGDITPLTENYEALKVKTLAGLERIDGLISSKSEKLNDEFMSRLGFKDNRQRIRDIVDWPPAQKDTGWKLVTPEGERDGYELVPVNTVVNAYHYINLKLMSEIAGRLGKKDDEIFFLERSLLVRQSINNKLFDKNHGRYIDGENSSHSSIHANMFPLAFGLVPDEHLKSVISFIKSRGMACSVYGSQFLLEGLYKANEADYALDLLTSTTDRSWWNMIKSGSTITMEAWDMKYKPNSDLNHAWGAAPANIISRELWGIKPQKPGYSEVIIKPQMSRLTSSRIMVPTIIGSITGEFISVNKRDMYSISLPSGMKGELILPGKKYAEVFVNNRRIETSSDKITLGSGLTKIEIQR